MEALNDESAPSINQEYYANINQTMNQSAPHAESSFGMHPGPRANYNQIPMYPFPVPVMMNFSCFPQQTTQPMTAQGPQNMTPQFHPKEKKKKAQNSPSLSEIFGYGSNEPQNSNFGSISYNNQMNPSNNFSNNGSKRAKKNKNNNNNFPRQKKVPQKNLQRDNIVNNGPESSFQSSHNDANENESESKYVLNSNDELSEQYALNKIFVSKILKGADLNSPFYCSKHKRDYLTKEAYQQHIRSSHKQFKCQVCQKTFDTKKALASHSRSHTYKCPKCEKEFQTKKGLTSHLETHKYECKICHKLFNSDEMLKTHKEIHLYKCDYCGQGFLSQEDLTEHSYSHYYYCSVCNAAFLTQAQLDQHFNDSHFIKCTNCYKKFKSESAMNAHYNAVHKKDEKSFTCPIDNKKFISQIALDMHYSSKHPYYCEEHKKSFLSEEALNAHNRAKHNK